MRTCRKSQTTDIISPGLLPLQQLARWALAPEGWGEPVALFALGDDCSVNHFAQMSLVFDITLCGQAAGPNFASDCPGRGKGSSSTGQCIVCLCPCAG